MIKLGLSNLTHGTLMGRRWNLPKSVLPHASFHSFPLNSGGWRLEEYWVRSVEWARLTLGSQWLARAEAHGLITHQKRVLPCQGTKIRFFSIPRASGAAKGKFHKEIWGFSAQPCNTQVRQPAERLYGSWSRAKLSCFPAKRVLGVKAEYA